MQSQMEVYVKDIVINYNNSTFYKLKILLFIVFY
jgi:hypothetical protein